ncbi:PLP-dependent aminotransferase family protein [Reinekea sp.]|uniref:aminotransferase-like domain-containing protein n=1 Tax=Reinekea sp. TaxID=1970455 RepID=UPI003988F716
MSTQITLYEQLAESLIEQIHQGRYLYGQKLPSVRELAKQAKVSIATVNSAYAQLEQQGWVEARLKSGYYVKNKQNSVMKRPNSPGALSTPRPVTTSDLVMEVQHENASPDGINLCTALPDLTMPICAVLQKTYTRLSRTANTLQFGYDSPIGEATLRQQISRRAVDAGVFVSPEAIITTAGCQNAVAMSLRVLTKPGDVVAIESTCYYGLLQIVESFGLKAIEVPTHADTGMSIEALDLALNQWDIKAVLVVSAFSNPLGCTIPDDRKTQLVALINQHKTFLIEDDIYGDLSFDGHRPKAVKSFDDEGRVIYCSSVSKTIHPQLRVGWVMPGQVFDQLLHFKYINTVSMPILPQLVAAEIMAHGVYDRHLRLAREKYRQRCAQLREMIKQYFPPRTRISKPKGGLALWVECTRNVDATALYHQLREQGIRIAPGELFSSSGSSNHCFRITFATQWTPKRVAAIKVIGEHLHRLME